MTGPLGPHCVVLGSAVRPPLHSADTGGGFAREQASVDSCQFCSL